MDFLVTDEIVSYLTISLDLLRSIFSSRDVPHVGEVEGETLFTVLLR